MTEQNKQGRVDAREALKALVDQIQSEKFIGFDWSTAFERTYQNALLALQEPADTAPAEAKAVGERVNWTTGDWAKHVGAWQDEAGNVCFGSWMAVNAMLIQFYRAHFTHPAPAPADAEADKRDAERHAELLRQDWFKMVAEHYMNLPTTATFDQFKAEVDQDLDACLRAGEAQKEAE